METGVLLYGGLVCPSWFCYQMDSITGRGELSSQKTTGYLYGHSPKPTVSLQPESSCRGNIEIAVFQVYPGKGSFPTDPHLARERTELSQDIKLQRWASVLLLIERSWSWSGSCGGGVQEIEIFCEQVTCVLGSEISSSSVGVTCATWEVVGAFSWVG